MSRRILSDKITTLREDDWIRNFGDRIIGVVSNDGVCNCNSFDSHMVVTIDEDVHHDNERKQSLFQRLVGDDVQTARTYSQGP